MLDKYQHSDLEQIKSSSFLEQMSSIGICKAMLKLNLEFNVLRALGGSHIGSWQKELDLPTSQACKNRLCCKKKYLTCHYEPDHLLLLNIINL